MHRSLHFAVRAYHSRLVRVLMFGGAGVLAQTAVFEIGIWVLLLRPSVATLIGAECGILTSFILNNRFSFAKHHHPVIHRLLRYHLVVSGSLFIQWLSVFVAESLTHNIWIIHGAYMVGIIVGFFFNYTGYRLFVWHPKQ